MTIFIIEWHRSPWMCKPTMNSFTWLICLTGVGSNPRRHILCSVNSHIFFHNWIMRFLRILSIIPNQICDHYVFSVWSIGCVIMAALNLIWKTSLFLKMHQVRCPLIPFSRAHCNLFFSAIVRCVPTTGGDACNVMLWSSCLTGEVTGSKPWLPDLEDAASGLLLMGDLGGATSDLSLHKKIDKHHA